MALFSKKTRPDAPRTAPDRKAKAAASAPKKAKKAPPLAQDIRVSPFFADHTRDGLADRFNELRAKRSDHVLVTLCLGACLLASLGMNAYQVMRGNVVVQAVVLDGENGHILHNETLEPLSSVEDFVLQREIRDVVSDLRTVTTDQPTTLKRIATAYGKVVKGSGADLFLQDYYARPESDTRELTANGGQRTVVEFTGPARVEGTNTWTVSWVERTAVGGGSNAGVTQDLYRASMTAKQIPVTDLETAQTNPLGFFLDGLQWEKVSSKVLDLEELGGITTLEALYPGVPVAREPAAERTQPTAQAAE